MPAMSDRRIGRPTREPGDELLECVADVGVEGAGLGVLAPEPVRAAVLTRRSHESSALHAGSRAAVCSSLPMCLPAGGSLRTAGKPLRPAPALPPKPQPGRL